MKKLFTILALLMTAIMVGQNNTKPRYESVRLVPSSSAPANPIEGELYFDSDDNGAYKRTNGVWALLGLVEITQTNYDLLSIDEQGAGQYVITDGSGVATKLSIGGSIANLQSAIDNTKINNENLFYYNVISSDEYDFTSEDVEISSGADAGKKVINSVDSGTRNITLQNSDIPIGGTAIFESNGGDANIFFEEGNSASIDNLSGSNNAFSIAGSTRDRVVLTKRADNTFRADGSFTAFEKTFGYTPVSGSTPSSANNNTELVTGVAAAFGDGDAGEGIEENKTDPWFSIGDFLTNATSASVADTSGWGSYMYELTATATSDGRVTFALPASASTTYEYIFMYRMTQGTNGGFWIDSADVSDPVDIEDLSSTTFTYLEGTVTTLGGATNISFRIHVTDDAGGSIGDKMEWKLTVKAQ